MPLTNEEYNYFTKGIATFRSLEVKTESLEALQYPRSSEAVIKDLNDAVNGDFIAIISAKGIQTPASLISQSNSDIAKIQTFVGYTPPPTDTPSPSNEQPGENMLESVNMISSRIDDIVAKDEVSDAKLKEHDESINNIYDILHISNTAEAVEIHTINAKDNTAHNTLGTPTYKITGEPKIVTSCKRINGVYELGNVIAQGNPSILGIFKAFFNCSAWNNQKTIDHYFTTTGDITGCSPLLPSESVFSECIGALGISIDNILP
jgi:hypothetical protein